MDELMVLMNNSCHEGTRIRRLFRLPTLSKLSIYNGQCFYYLTNEEAGLPADLRDDCRNQPFIFLVAISFSPRS
jgi:hypothetical protein